MTPGGQNIDLELVKLENPKFQYFKFDGNPLECDSLHEELDKKKYMEVMAEHKKMTYKSQLKKIKIKISNLQPDRDKLLTSMKPPLAPGTTRNGWNPTAVQKETENMKALKRVLSAPMIPVRHNMKSRKPVSKKV